MQIDKKIFYCFNCHHVLRKEQPVCDSCKIQRPKQGWPNLRPQTSMSYCPQCFNLLMDQSEDFCPVCGMQRPETGWPIMPFNIGEYQVFYILSNDKNSAYLYAIDTTTNKLVILRIAIKQDTTGNLFLEQEILNQLNDLNLSRPLKPLEEIDNKNVSVISFVPGIPLSKLMENFGRIQIKNALKIAIALSELVIKLKERAVMPFNIRPEYILISQKGPLYQISLLGLEHTISKVNASIENFDLDSAEYSSIKHDKEFKESSIIYNIAAILWKSIVGENYNPEEDTTKPYVMPTTVYIELKRALNPDWRKRPQKLEIFVQILKEQLTILEDFNRLINECEKLIKDYKHIDQMVMTNPGYKKALKLQNITIPKINRQKQVLDDLCKQVKDYRGDVNIHRERLKELNRFLEQLKGIEPLSTSTFELWKWIILFILGGMLIGGSLYFSHRTDSSNSGQYEPSITHKLK